MRKSSGDSHKIDSIATLKQWISEGKIADGDLLSRNLGPWKRIADIPELQQFFSRKGSRMPASAGFTKNPSESNLDATMRRVPPAGEKRDRQDLFSSSAPRVSLPSKSEGPQPNKVSKRSEGPFLNDKPTLPPPLVPGDRLENKTTTNLEVFSRQSVEVKSSHPKVHPEPIPTVEAVDTTEKLIYGKTARAKNAKEEKKALGKPVQPEGKDPDFSQIPAAQDDLTWGRGSGVEVSGPAWARRTGPLPKYRDDKESRPLPPRRTGRWIAVAIVGILAISASMLLFLIPESGQAILTRLDGAVSSSEQERFQKFFDRGQEFFLFDAENAYRQADREFQKALALSENQPSTLAALGQMYGVWAQYITDKILDIETDIKSANADANATAGEHIEIERLRRERDEKVNEAQQWSTRAVTADPQLPEAQLAMADALRLRGDLKAAASHLNRVIGAGANTSANARYISILLALDRGEPADGPAKQLGEINAKKPLIRTMYREARVLAGLGQGTRAEAVLTDLFALNSTHQPGRDLAERIHSGKPVSLKLVPTGDGAPVVIGAAVSPPRVDRADGHPGAPAPVTAAEQENVIGAKSETGVDEMIDKAQKLQAKGRFRASKELYEAALEKEPNNPDALTGIAYCDLDQGSTGRAIAHLRRALEDNHSFGPAIFGLGEAYQASGQNDQALKYYRQYLEISPSGRQAGMARTSVAKLEAAQSGVKGSEESPSPESPSPEAESPVESPAESQNPSEETPEEPEGKKVVIPDKDEASSELNKPSAEE